MPSSRPMENDKFLILVDDDYEDLELWYPKLRLIEAGAKVTVAGPPGKHHFHDKHDDPAKWHSSRSDTGRNSERKKDTLDLLKQKSDERSITLVYGAR